jgi:hypothetical protein
MWMLANHPNQKLDLDGIEPKSGGQSMRIVLPDVKQRKALVRVRWFWGSIDWQQEQLEPITGIPWLDPDPRSSIAVIWQIREQCQKALSRNVFNQCRFYQKSDLHANEWAWSLKTICTK